MNKFIDIEFPFRFCREDFMLKGKMSIPEMAIKLTSASSKNKTLLVFPKFLRHLERNQQKNLQEAWIDWAA